MSCTNLDVCRVCVEYGIVLEGCVFCGIIYMSVSCTERVCVEYGIVFEGCVCCGIIYMWVSCTERHACVMCLYASYLLSFRALRNEMLVCENISSRGWCFCSSFFVSHLIIVGNVITACPAVTLQWGFCLVFYICKSTGLVVLFFIFFFFVFLFFSYRVENFLHGFNQIKNKTENNNKQWCLFSFTSTEYVACTFAVLLWMFQYMLYTLLFSIRRTPLSPGETSPSLRQGDRNSQGAGVNPCDVEKGWSSECRPFFFSSFSV